MSCSYGVISVVFKYVVYWHGLSCGFTFTWLLVMFSVDIRFCLVCIKACLLLDRDSERRSDLALYTRFVRLILRDYFWKVYVDALWLEQLV